MTKVDYKCVIVSCHMLEFLFGWLIGVWMGQQLPLPLVQTVAHNWWFPNSTVDSTTTVNDSSTVSDAMKEDHESSPLFTGDMPAATPV